MSKRKTLKKDPNRYAVAKLPDRMRQFEPPSITVRDIGLCDLYEDKINEALLRDCALRGHFTVESGRPCAKGAGAKALVDLVIVIDTSGSMNNEAKDIADAADEAIAKAKKSCPSKLEVTWLGIEGTWPDTKFTQSYRDYFTSEGISIAGLVGTEGDLEDGAAAIMDISSRFNWRKGASRNIFYLGDEALEGGYPHNATDVAAADGAIKVANDENVTVFTYAGVGTPPLSEYKRVATETGGSFFKAPVSNLGGFQTVLEKIICASKAEGCRPVEMPEIRPCFQITWGEGPRDHMETDDVELLCITASNPYSNVTIKNLRILFKIISEHDNSPVPTLPDGTPSSSSSPTT